MRSANQLKASAAWCCVLGEVRGDAHVKQWHRLSLIDEQVSESANGSACINETDEMEASNNISRLAGDN